MKRKVWMLVQQLLPKRNSQRWEPKWKVLAYEPWLQWRTQKISWGFHSVA